MAGLGLLSALPGADDTTSVRVQLQSHDFVSAEQAAERLVL